METSSYPALQVAVAGSVATLTLNRPEVHNALNAELIQSLTAAVQHLSSREDLRALVLRGAGPSFSAGGDIRWMRDSLAWSADQNMRDAVGLAALFEEINTCPLATIAVVQGAALGGGAGLMATCDIVIAADNATFGFTEVRLGLIPATIGPYVVARIGAARARSLFLTGSRFDAHQAEAFGLVHRVVPSDQLDTELAGILAALRASGPQAIRAAKALIAHVAGKPTATVMYDTAAAIAHLRTTPEAQEGLTAFLEKRRAAWVEEA